MDRYVSQDEFNWVRGKDRIMTEGAGPCILIGIHDKVEKTAYLIHEEFACMSTILDNFIELIKTHSDPKNLTAHVSGGSIFTGVPKAERDDLIENREIVLRKLEEFMQPSQIHCEWAKNDTESKMLIEAETGIFSFSF